MPTFDALDLQPLYKRLVYRTEEERAKYASAVAKVLLVSGGSSAGDAPGVPKRKRVLADEDSDGDGSEEDVPLSKRKAGNGTAAAKKKAPPPPPKGKKEKAPPPPKKKKARKEAAPAPKRESTKAKVWDTLEHSACLFPPEYEPHGVKLRYDGQPVTLTPKQEEVATWYAAMLHSDYMAKDTFQKNFWAGFSKLLGKGHVIKDLKKVDFTPIAEYLEAEKEKKKNMTKEEKKAAKEAKDKMEAPFLFATLNGQKEKVGNFRVEPPGLFRGRGEHPKMGMLKERIQPEDVIINIGKDARLPVPYTHTADFQLVELKGRHWKEVRNDQHVAWMAGWHDTINIQDWKYVQFAATSSVKAESDLKKYEKARKLCKYIDKIRQDYTKAMKSSDIERAQLACATYLVDKLALRAGGEKDEDEADTVGVTTLRLGHLTFDEDGETVHFDFLGKDSIRYEQSHKLTVDAYQAMKRFASCPREKSYERNGKKYAAGQKKCDEDDLFGHIDPPAVNEHLASLVPELRPTIKVFRTYNASILLDNMLSMIGDDREVQSTKGRNTAIQVGAKVEFYNKANKEVAILCNHQKAVAKNHGEQLEKKVAKRDEVLGKIKELKKDKSVPADKKAAKMKALEDQLDRAERAVKQKEDLKTVSLNTSKINYMDPRITIAFCKKFDVPIEKCFNRALLEKFGWAMEGHPDWRFDPSVDPTQRLHDPEDADDDD